MDLGRREILKNTGLLLGLHTLSPILNINDFIESIIENIDVKGEPPPIKTLLPDNLFIPKLLGKNAKIGITAPASPANMISTVPGRNYFRRQGFELVFGDTVQKQKNNFRYLSAPDEVRAAEFMEFIERDDIDAIVCARGGYGSMRILPMLDYDIIRNNPKIIVGFSDITALILAIYKKCGFVTYHGPVASSDFDDYTSRNLLAHVSEHHFNKKSVITTPESAVINKGYSTGTLIGGNLTIFNALLGTEYEVDTQGSILFLEDNLQNAYEFDRLLTQLLLAGKIQRANGIIFGYFDNFNTRRPFFPNTGYSIKEVIDQLIKPLNIPCMVQMPFGHIRSKLTFPLGVNSTLDTEKKQLIINYSSILANNDQ